MRISFYDTKCRQKRVFRPIEADRVTIYACGPTVYDRIHIGNGLSAVVFDVLVRFLRLVYPKVVYVRNITDIDDKIIDAANEANEPFETIAQRYTDAFHEDIEALHVLPPDIEPRPTLLIAKICAMIETLIDRGHAYESNGHVLFEVNSFDDYGKLSNRSLEEMLDGARVEVAPYKRDPKDFVLWKPSESDVPGWSSPWGRGRPGWHIECSAMIHEHLGSTIDIHGAGNDLTFPHNENELAQGKCIEEGANYVNYWMHNGMLNLGGRKMSKSLGNIQTIQGLLERFDSEVIRYALLTGHYRQSLLWNDDLLNRSSRSLDSLYRAVRHANEQTDGIEKTSKDFKDRPLEEYPSGVLDALADDLHTPRALASIHGIARRIHQATDKVVLLGLRDHLLMSGWLLGLMNKLPTDYFRSETTLDETQIEELLSEREQARLNKDFTRADEIRAELQDQGIEVEDTPEGPRWTKLRRTTNYSS